MATVKSRINISLPDDVREALELLARQEKVPAATKAARLLEVGLELEEDQAWDMIADARDLDTATFVSHDDAW